MVLLIAVGVWVKYPTEKIYEDLSDLSDRSLESIKQGKVPAEVYRDDEVGSKLRDILSQKKGESEKLRKIYENIIKTQEASPGTYLAWHRLEEIRLQKKRLNTVNSLEGKENFQQFRKEQTEIKKGLVEAFEILEEGIKKYPSAEALLERHDARRQRIERYKEELQSNREF